MARKRVVAYLRTSSNANAGENKDSYARQLQACKRYASGHNMDLKDRDVYYDKGMSGSTHVATRPQFELLLGHAIKKHVDTILVEVCCVDLVSSLLL